MSKAERTREHIIEKSAPVFNKKGYAGTSMNDLVEATGLTKGSIYGNFENKDEVAREVFKYHMSSLYQRISDSLKDKSTATEQLLGITEFYRRNWKTVFERGGCPLQNASVEADDNLRFLKKDVQESVKRWALSIERIIEKGQQSGEFKKQCKPSDYAYLLLTLLEGGIMLGKIMNNQKFVLDAVDRIDLIFKSELIKSSKT